MKTTSLMSKTALVIAIAAVSACSSMDKQVSTRSAMEMDKESEMAALSTSELDTKMAQIQSKESALRQQQMQIDQRNRELNSKEMSLTKWAKDLESAPAQQAAPMMHASMAAGDTLFPPAKQAGQCFARVFVPTKYRTNQERILVSEASERIEVIPAAYTFVDETVQVSDPSERLVVVPATYKWIEERVMVKPTTSRMVQIPASYSTKTERVLVEPAHSIWKKGTGPIQRVDQATGEIMCLVEVPAKYQTISTRVQDKPATTRLIEEPAQYDIVKKRVVDQAASTRTITIPAQYKTVKVQKIIRPAQEKRIEIPAKYSMVAKTEKVADGHMAWREILCETNLTRGRVGEIQTALKTKGHNPGPIDGVIGPQTMQAVNAFQRAEKLPVDRYLNVKTVQALGVSPR